MSRQKSSGFEIILLDNTKYKQHQFSPSVCAFHPHSLAGATAARRRRNPQTIAHRRRHERWRLIRRPPAQLPLRRLRPPLLLPLLLLRRRRRPAALPLQLRLREIPAERPRPLRHQQTVQLLQLVRRLQHGDLVVDVAPLRRTVAHVGAAESRERGQLLAELARTAERVLGRMEALQPEQLRERRQRAQAQAGDVQHAQPRRQRIDARAVHGERGGGAVAIGRHAAQLLFAGPVLALHVQLDETGQAAEVLQHADLVHAQIEFLQADEAVEALDALDAVALQVQVGEIAQAAQIGDAPDGVVLQIEDFEVVGAGAQIVLQTIKINQHKSFNVGLNQSLVYVRFSATAWR